MRTPSERRLAYLLAIRELDRGCGASSIEAGHAAGYGAGAARRNDLSYLAARGWVRKARRADATVIHGAWRLTERGAAVLAQAEAEEARMEWEARVEWQAQPVPSEPDRESRMDWACGLIDESEEADRAG